MPFYPIIRRFEIKGQICPLTVMMEHATVKS